MRRVISILLLVIFGLPAVAPLFAAAPRSEASLPACCRMHGKHHCFMGMVATPTLSSSKPQFRAPLERCPYAPALISGVHTTIYAPPAAPAIYAGLISHPAVAAQTESKLLISRGRSRQKRGPPASFL
jgi:hypothetical protein